MRLLIKLKAQRDATYQTAYHNKLRGRLWRALDGTSYDELHDTGDPPGFTYSNVFPWGDITENDDRSVLVASPKEGLLSTMAKNLQSDREFNVGEMSFSVDDLTAVSPDVGEPGSTGVIETATGVLVRLYDDHRTEYGIDDDHGDAPTYWRPKHTVEPFRNAIEENLQRKHEQFAPDYYDGPAEADGQLFDGYELIKTYAIPLTVTAGETIEVLLSKWRFDYEVRDDAHRRHLNLALDTGIGGRNALGLGFVNITEKTRPAGKEVADALS